MSAQDRHAKSFGQPGGGRRNRQPAVITPPVVTFAPVEYEVLKELAASEWSSLKTADRELKKAQQKRYLDKYREFLAVYIENGDSYPNTILFYALVWAADTGDFDTAIALGDVIVKTGQRFELGFKRDAITLCCDEVMLAQEKYFEASKQLTHAFKEVFERIQAKRWQPDNVITTGKFYRMAGRYEKIQNNYKQAYDFFCEADAINPRAGVKKLMEDMKTRI